MELLPQKLLVRGWVYKMHYLAITVGKMSQDCDRATGWKKEDMEFHLHCQPSQR